MYMVCWDEIRLAYLFLLENVARHGQRITDSEEEHGQDTAGSIVSSVSHSHTFQHPIVLQRTPLSRPARAGIGGLKQ